MIDDDKDRKERAKPKMTSTAGITEEINITPRIRIYRTKNNDEIQQAFVGQVTNEIYWIAVPVVVEGKV